MKRIAVFLATLGGLGYLRWAPGTWGSLVGLLGGVITLSWFNDVTLGELPRMFITLMAILAVKFVICAFMCTMAERALGIHDAPAIILDEAWGMAAIVMAAPWTAVESGPWLIMAFLLFRLFDIVKPFPLKRLATLPEGWGIMADDLGAAAYTVLILQGIGLIHFRS